MDGGEVDGCSTRAEEQEVISLNGLVPCLVDCGLTYNVIGGIAVVFRVSKLLNEVRITA